MPEITFPFYAVWRTLENGLTLGEAIRFPEFSRLAKHRDRIAERLQRQVRRAVDSMELHLPRQSLVADNPDSLKVTVSIPPPAWVSLWRDDVTVDFDVVCWHQGGIHLAFVPALNLELAADKEDILRSRLPAEILSALYRIGWASSLRYLVELQRTSRFDVEPLSVTIDIKSPKRRAVESQDLRDRRKSVLKTVAINLRRHPGLPVYRVEGLVSQLANALSGNTPRSVLLVGPAGAGKTAIVRELARQRIAHGFRATPFFSTSGSRLVAGMTGYGMWQQRCREVIREASQRKVILHLGHLVELMHVGKSEGNPTGIASYLRPAIARAEILAIAECTPEQIPMIEREDPQLVDAFVTIQVEEPNEATGRGILQDFANAFDRSLATGAKNPLPQVLAEGALATLDRLHRRFATYSAYPGRPLRFLQNLLAKADPDKPVAEADVIAEFSNETGLPRLLLDPRERFQSTAIRDWFASRVMGQPEAVELVTGLIGNVKSAMTPPGRPIASLLFVGPTGVGKTETAKALAEFFFGSASRLTRFDMSEYGDSISVQRLIGTAFGAEGLLTARVREQPFSVVLLDEFEKAHPQFFDLLLQILGEGRLTDAAGRLADFRNAIVILTSNLGAESFQQGRVGFRPADVERAEAREHFTRVAEGFLRPELYNRLDRLVAFAPLSLDVERKIADRQLQLLATREGVRYRGVDLAIDSAVREYLAEAGFDPRYGARPLKRVIEQRLVAPLADQLNRYSTDQAVSARVAMVDGAIDVRVKPRTDERGRALSLAAATPKAVTTADHCVLRRRQARMLIRCPATVELRNELFRFEQIEAHWLARLRRADRLRRAGQAVDPANIANPLSASQQTRYAELREDVGNIDRHGQRCLTLEERALAFLYRASDADDAGVIERLSAEAAEAEREFESLLLKLLCRRYTDPSNATIAIFSDHREWLGQLAEAYYTVATRCKARVQVYSFHLPDASTTLPPDEDDEFEAETTTDLRWREDCLIRPKVGRAPESIVLTRKIVWSPSEYFSRMRGDPIGFAMGLTGPAVAPRFGPEDGRHELGDGRNQGASCLVQVPETRPGMYIPPEGITRRGTFDDVARRRLYDPIHRTVQDALTGKQAVPWTGQLADVLGKRINEQLWKTLIKLLEE
jgi:ATP-dependent Clp protease ATP-binding subunit ClpA